MKTVVLNCEDMLAAKFWGSRMGIVHGPQNGSKAVVVLSPGEAVLLAQAIQEYYPNWPANLSMTAWRHQDASVS